MSAVLTLSGWTQPSDAIASLLPVAAEAFDYSVHAPVEDALAALGNYRDVPHVIGWSMGAQLAMLAVMHGVLKPKKLTLIAPPVQFVQSEHFKHAMEEEIFRLFHDQYVSDTERLSSRFHGLIAKNDARRKQVMAMLAHHPHLHEITRWQPWLAHLGRSSLMHAAFERLPDTQIIHGTRDAIVPVEQSAYITQRAHHIKRYLWQDAAHAPHLHDHERFVAQIMRHHEGLA